MRSAFVVLAVAVAATSLAAQDTTATPAQPAQVLGPRCNGETISIVMVDRQEPVMVERSAGWARPFLRFALAGAPTRSSAVAPFLLVRQGEKCTEILLRESERVLRAQPYIADARALVVPDTNNTVRVQFSTTDDIRPILGLGVKNGSPTRIKIGSGNVAGYGMAATVQWQQGFAFDDGLAVHFTDYHTFGQPYLLDSHLERSPLGEIYSASLSKPLYSQLQRIAWSASIGKLDRYQTFRRGKDEDPLSLEVDRTSWSANAVYRIGGGSNGLFAGGQVGGDRLSTADSGVIITDTGFVADPDGTLGPRYRTTTRTLAAAIFGVRALRFFKAESFDALEGAQDVANGIQLGTLLGHSISGDAGWFAGSQLYAGAGSPKSFVGVQMAVETGRANGDFSDMIAEGRVAWYSRPTRRRTRIASVEFSGAWDTSVPFQLRLGTDHVGLRGYEDSETGGGRRAVARLEERMIFPGIAKYLGFGGAAFLDAGKMWAGDVPFGRTVNPRVGAGVGLIFAVPRSSRQNLRVDVAAPLISDGGSKWGVNVTITSGRPRFWRPASDLARARSTAQTPVVFGWP
ncbi:MAG TPA: BamA/TamA family outer membrane protein [Gemmatimonadaceae bacterium]|nr:BamA/TamA family outer membrane protein [Gemmatimonadaceae bacterium]